jgi:hypothetical protein
VKERIAWCVSVAGGALASVALQGCLLCQIENSVTVTGTNNVVSVTQSNTNSSVLRATVYPATSVNVGAGESGSGTNSWF